jgi:hypothetical protein
VENRKNTSGHQDEKDFFWRRFQSTGNKSKNRHMWLSQTKTFYMSKATAGRLEMESLTSDKTFRFRKYKKPQKLNSKKPDNPIKNAFGHFSKEDL